MPRYSGNRYQAKPTLVRTILIHPVLWFVVATSLIVATAGVLWNEYQTELGKQVDFEITPDKIDIVNAEPEWVSTGLASRLIERPILPKSLLSPKLIEQVANEIKTVGWVSNIQLIEKTAEGIRVDVNYRQPSALVFFPTAPHTIPVDSESLIMDSHEIKLEQLQALPRIHVFRPAADPLIAWSVWPDQRVQEAVKLANFLGSSWQALGFYQIVSQQPPGKDSRQPFELYPKKGAVVIWGSAPGQELPGEASAEAKFKALGEFVLANGDFELTNPGDLYDVRSGRMLKSKKIRTAQEPDFSDVEKSLQ